MKIIKNSLKCITCGDVLVSNYRHDFVKCSCPANSDTVVYIDGGTSYLKRSVGKSAIYEDLSEIEESFNKIEDPGKM